MDDDATKGVRRRGVKRDGKLSRRVWSTAEEEALLECLREIVRTDWKSENGFRTGYLGVLEQLLNRSCPNRCVGTVAKALLLLMILILHYYHLQYIMGVTYAVPGTYYRLILSQRRCDLNHSLTIPNGVTYLERIEQQVNVALILFLHHVIQAQRWKLNARKVFR
ncbi:UNVERIFIED_CONTAM: hypothetical protein Sradi_0189300 [Sesamum radiatum]|uniref:Uncharacterized protein n=1 Tax=Sesamum radiatum TaxID=300843 RepID=A0AAW2VYL9_SESRA